MSILIDDLVKNGGMNSQNYDKDSGKWYRAKPYGYFGIKGLVIRVKDAWRVLVGKSRAYHYHEDEVK